jgi:hypothetical protein
MNKETKRICFLLGSGLLVISILQALIVTPNLVWIPEIFGLASMSLVIYGSTGIAPLTVEHDALSKKELKRA